MYKDFTQSIERERESVIVYEIGIVCDDDCGW